MSIGMFFIVGYIERGKGEETCKDPRTKAEWQLRGKKDQRGKNVEKRSHQP